MRRVRRKVGNKEKVFGCDLLEHLTATSQEIPLVLKSCSEFVEHHGIVDGIYRLSGVSSNIQKLRAEFESDGNPDLNKDVYLQDIHCVSSLCKAYFRELPNPLLTYQLYDKFAEAVAIQLEGERLVKIRDVLKELPPPHLRTLEFLMCHLVKMASFSSETNMHARNLAIVWAPNLLRSKDIEATGFNGTAAFMEVRVQSIVVEFILTHVPQLFPLEGVSSERRNSLPSPSALTNQEEVPLKCVPTHISTNFGNISPGDGPLAIRPYHAIIEGTDKRKGSLKGKKWMSIFNIGGRFPDPRRRHKQSSKEKERPVLRPARSMDSLSSPSFPEGSRRPGQRPPSTNMSPLVTAATQSGSDVAVCTNAGATGPSEYAVTYRRGTGLVSGGTGTQGTYTALDPEGLSLLNCDTVNSRSPGLSSKTGKRAAMHITGPTLVTVPLHITSNLARVIHRDREKDGGDRGDGKEGGERVERQESGRTERKGVEVRKVVREDKNHKAEETDREGVVDGEGDTVADVAGEEKGGEKQEEAKEEEVEEEEKEEEKEEEVREELKPKPVLAGRSTSREERVESRMSSVEGEEEEEEEAPAEDIDADENSEYMEMKGVRSSDIQSQETHVEDDSVYEGCDVLNSTEMEGENQELYGYVQDNFEFLDHMDCLNVSSQVNEFSVEPPSHYDDDYEDMEQAQASHHPQPDPKETHPFKPHRPVSLDLDSRHTKSLSLPYMVSPIHEPQEGWTGEEYSDESVCCSSDEDESMYIKSLPADYFLNNYSELDTESRGLNRLLDDSKSKAEPLQTEFSACKEPTAGNHEQREEKDEEEEEEEEEAEGDKDGQEREEAMKMEEEATFNQGGHQPEGNMQSGATEVDLSTVKDAHCDEVQPLPSEVSTHCCTEFPPPLDDDTDEYSTMADMKVEEEGKEVVDNLRCDYPPGDADSCADDSAESGDFFNEMATDQFDSCVTGEKKGGEDEEVEVEERELDKEIEDICQERERKESRSETALDVEIKESGEIADKKPEEKMEEDHLKTLCRTISNMWDELQEVVCEVIEDEESTQGERKAVEEGVDREVNVVEDVDQTAMVSGEKVVEVEDEMKNKTEDKIEVVEEPGETTQEKHKDAETLQEFEEKETNLPKTSELAVVLNEGAKDHEREEVEQKENKDKANEHRTLPLSVHEKDKGLKEVKSDIKESNEGRKWEDIPGGVGRKLVITKQSPMKVYQVKAVPVVPPKPQHCKMTALTIRQQHERERREAAKASTEGGEQKEKDGDVETDEGRGKKDLLGITEKERRRDGDEGATRDPTARNSPLSICFDEAVAIATMRREKEKECEKEKHRGSWGSEVQ